LRICSRASEIRIRITLKEAINICQLGALLGFEDKSRAKQIEWLRERNQQVVRPGTDDATSNIIEVAFRCEAPKLAAQVVTSVVTAYERETNRVTTEANSEKFSKPETMRDQYDQRAKKAHEEFVGFLTTAHHDMLALESDPVSLLNRLIATKHTLIPKPDHRQIVSVQKEFKGVGDGVNFGQ
jgi:hypothetical protein